VSRRLEITLVVLALVGLPVGAGLVARSGAAAPPTPVSALAFARPLVKDVGFTAARCAWSPGHTHADCSLRGGGTCSFDLREHTGSCSKGAESTDVFLVWAEAP
jgi:hypothetical protein